MLHVPLDMCQIRDDVAGQSHLALCCRDNATKQNITTEKNSKLTGKSHRMLNLDKVTDMQKMQSITHQRSFQQ